METLNLAWFLATIYGRPFTPLDADLYESVFLQAELELSQVKCFCPKIYPHAMSIKIALILTAARPSENGDVMVGASVSDTKAYVVEDTVYDTTRKYKILEGKEDPNSPQNMLRMIVSKCKPALTIGALTVRGAAACNTDCWDTDLYNRFVEHADKADN